MTVERSKCRFLIPIVFTTKCFKKPLLVIQLGIQKQEMNAHITHGSLFFFNRLFERIRSEIFHLYVSIKRDILSLAMLLSSCY